MGKGSFEGGLRENPKHQVHSREDKGDLSISAQFFGFCFEPPGDDELPPGCATLSATVLCCLMHESLRLLEFVVGYCMWR
ncbi:hypothetical protein DEO72_LG2g3906 [Vigna unguiculata]|uniref:Uncharacterized protein n=1 Tax=Vigna unguiculata TaxID=3917 RepID=A0A4D6L504_VIGUN|nr:hypothetical protein DEO72_LG2g3906 [Vigna unguiculata]